MMAIDAGPSRGWSPRATVVMTAGAILLGSALVFLAVSGGRAGAGAACSGYETDVCIAVLPYRQACPPVPPPNMATGRPRRLDELVAAEVLKVV